MNAATSRCAATCEGRTTSQLSPTANRSAARTPRSMACPRLRPLAGGGAGGGAASSNCVVMIPPGPHSGRVDARYKGDEFVRHALRRQGTSGDGDGPRLPQARPDRPGLRRGRGRQDGTAGRGEQVGGPWRSRGHRGLPPAGRSAAASVGHRVRTVGPRRVAVDGWGEHRRPVRSRTELGRADRTDRRRQSTVLIVEDLHWADGSTLDLLAYLASTLQSRSLSIAVTMRDDEADQGRDDRDGTCGDAGEARPAAAPDLARGRRRGHQRRPG